MAEKYLFEQGVWLVSCTVQHTCNSDRSAIISIEDEIVTKATNSTPAEVSQLGVVAFNSRASSRILGNKVAGLKHRGDEPSCRFGIVLLDVIRKSGGVLVSADMDIELPVQAAPRPDDFRPFVRRAFARSSSSLSIRCLRAEVIGIRGLCRPSRSSCSRLAFSSRANTSRTHSSMNAPVDE